MKELDIICENYEKNEYVLVDKKGSNNPKDWIELSAGTYNFCATKMYSFMR